MSAQKIGSNMKRLVAELVAVEAVPDGAANPMGAAVEFILGGGMGGAWRRAYDRARKVVDAVKAAPDNPYGDDEEAIAGEALKRVRERREAQRNMRLP